MIFKQIFMKIKQILFIFLLLHPLLLMGQEIRGKITYVSDGDTYHFVSEENNNKLRIRLSEVDCPETLQEFGLEAKEFVVNRILNKEVLIQIKEEDRYGRYVAHIIYDDGKSLAEELLKNGWAWHFKRYSDNDRFSELEEEARSKKLGLFANEKAIPPWEFRSKK